MEQINYVISNLQETIDKLEVFKYVYNSYSPKYIDNAINTFIHSKISLIELKLLDLQNNIDELYEELEISILDKYDIIESDINQLKAKEEKAQQIKNKVLPYLLHMNMILDKDSIYYTKSLKEIADDNIDKIKKEFNLE